MSGGRSLTPGIYVPLVTPFRESGAVDWGSLERIAEGCLAQGAAGLVALGTTGEPATLSEDEKDGVISCCSAVCRDRQRPLIAGVGGNDTAAVAREVERRGARGDTDAILSVVPYYTRPSEAGIVEHFKVIAAASAVPLLPYNIPFRTGRRLSASAVLELAADDRILGVKQSVGRIDEDTLSLVLDAPAGFLVMSGDDAFLFAMLSLGAAGGITASAHLVTAHFVHMHQAVMAERPVEARRLARALAPLVGALFAEPSPAVLKGVLAARGQIPTGTLRLPMTAAQPASVDDAASALAALDEAAAPARAP
ncbi:MAG: 4-hydroxy-tetrahydrodipicolinate synthase [Gaiellaceae bacterium]